MRLLVTGGAGMIGRRVVAQWRALGGDVAVLDNLSSGLPMPAQASLAVEGDLCDEDTLHRLMRTFRPHAILHLAAIHHIPTCENQRAQCLNVNVVGTERLLAAATEFNVARVALASSGAVYAWQENALDEQHSPLLPCDNYALSKYCNEQQLRFWSSQGRQRIGRAARIFNAVGHDDPNAHLIPEILSQLKQSSSGRVRLGNLTPRRDYLHADDIAAGLVALVQDSRETQAFDALNFCSGVEHSVAQLVQALADVLERTVQIEVDPARVRSVDRISQLGNPERTLAVLGWQPRMSFRQALHRVVFPDVLA
ncbi:NAD-dependent epimerase/dehydratase family protein [Pseudomonas sp. LRF_L74]|uniref:NAD-dependent epimerase/dehydratase family protein n=1 Tax=Pseudomonas sp. LRF_L74 TaxID=3369422 RepID=UPI003F63D98D